MPAGVVPAVMLVSGRAPALVTPMSSQNGTFLMALKYWPQARSGPAVRR